MQHWNKQEKRLHFFDKTHYSFLEKPMAEKYLHIWRVDQKAPQTRIQKVSCRKRHSHMSRSCFFVSVLMTTTKRGLFKRKNSKLFIPWPNFFGIQYFKRFSKSAKREFLTPESTPQRERSEFNYPSNYIQQHNEKKRSVSNLLHLCLKNVLAPVP